MRPEDTLTRRGRQYQQALEECRARYEQVAQKRARVPLLAALKKAEAKLDNQYRRERFSIATR